MTEKVCGCNAVTAAGVCTSLQLIVLVLTLGTTGMVLDRYRLWESYEPRGTVNLTEEAQYAAEGKTLVTSAPHWPKSFLETAMCWYVGFGTYWLFSILILALSFKYYRPVFVIPNYTALVCGCIMNLIAFGACLWRILSESVNYQTDEYEESVICYLMGLLLLAFIFCIIFVIIISSYHKFLRLRYGHQVPKFVQSRARTGYPEEMY